MSNNSDSPSANRYGKIIEWIFLKYYTEGARQVSFSRDDLRDAAEALGIKLPKNLGDIVYSFRYRGELPQSVRLRALLGEEWIIRPIGMARYQFVAAQNSVIQPNPLMAETRIPDSTPGLETKYSFDDEQALLVKLRYNRLVDVFTGITCYSLQNHLRTTVPNIGQVETDEIYVGVDRRGAHYIIPVQAKGGTDRLGIVQIEQDIALCAAKFPKLICRPVAAQFMQSNVIALFMFDLVDGTPQLIVEKHYRLVAPNELSAEELDRYRHQPGEPSS